VSEHKILVPRTDNPPAKVKDLGVISLVMSGRAAYNAKSGELLFLPEGASELRRVMNDAANRLSASGYQRVNCASDEAIFSLAERYVREWGDDATAFCEGRGRNIRILSWNRDESSAVASCEVAMGALPESLKERSPGGPKISIAEDVTEDDARTFALVSPCEAGDAGARPGFICASCGAAKFPDSPIGYIPAQPGAGEPEEPAEDVETPGANTITELCSQLGIGVTRTLKAMLYVAYDAAGERRAVASFVRGDYNLSMNKLSKWLRRERGLAGLRTAEKAELRSLVGEVAGYCGPAGMPDSVVVVADNSVAGSRNTVAGANRPGYHKKGCCHPRDFDPPIADIAQTTSGAPCECGGSCEAHALRELGVITAANATGRTDGVKVLSYRDREGAHDYPWVCAGSINAERVVIALSGRPEQ
jgi:prolyl-tRNA synthetase